MELQARIIREVARQGLLPFPSFFSSTKPFGTPLGPVALKGCLTVIVILLLPAKDAFNFVVELASYPRLVGDLPCLRPASLTLVVSRFKVFQAAMSAGVWILRRRRAIANVPPSPLQAWNGAIIAYLISSILLLVLPWYVCSIRFIDVPRSDLAVQGPARTWPCRRVLLVCHVSQ